jgi:hypothetical protein
MKKWIFAVAVATIISQTSNAQNAVAENTTDKKIQGGLSLNSGFLFSNFETNTINTNGLSGFFGLGFGANIKFTNNIGLFTGLEFHFERFGYKPNNTNFLYDFNDKNILQKDDDASTSQGTMRFMERRQNTVAANIPLMLLFRTNMIGYFRYFGKFGLRNSFLLQQRVTDLGFVGGALEQTELDGMRAANDMFLFRSAGGVSAGVEWNFASSTSLSVELGYYYGFTPLFWGNGKTNRDNSSLYVVDPVSGDREYRSFKAKQSVLELKAILLF